MSLTSEEQEYIKKLGKKIALIRKEQGLTQKDLGFAINVEESAIGRIEGGGTNPTLKTILRIAKALNTSASELISV